MNYFDLLGLSKEPFSSSPDPAFFFESTTHVQCLHRLEIAIRLRRGLNVCLGEIGTGKTTLCRTLIQQLNRDSDIVTHLVLDPYFTTGLEFLTTLHTRFLGKAPSPDTSQWELTEAIKNFLFHEVLENTKTMVLIVDEGQKLCLECLEVLRELLNYETNDAKLLQVVIFAQHEFSDLLTKRPNFKDRINEFCRLGPLGYNETKALIRHRLQLAGTSRELFTRPAYWAMFKATQGHPRKIMHLGHKVLLSLIMKNKSKASRSVVTACARAQGLLPPSFSRRFWVLSLLAVLLLAGIFSLAIHKNPFSTSHGDRATSKPAAQTTTWPVDRAAAQDMDKQQAQEAPGDHPADVPHPSPDHKPAVPEEYETLAEMPPVSTQTDSRPRLDADGRDFFIQIGSFQVEQYAEATASRYREKNYPAQVMDIVRGGAPWFIVVVQAFDSEPQAREWAVSFREKEQQEALVVQILESDYRVLPDAP